MKEVYYFDPEVSEFVPAVNESLSGNKVVVRWDHDPEGPTYRFQVSIDDFGSCVAAVNRLVRKFIPTFQPF